MFRNDFVNCGKVLLIFFIILKSLIAVQSNCDRCNCPFTCHPSKPDYVKYENQSSLVKCRSGYICNIDCIYPYNLCIPINAPKCDESNFQCVPENPKKVRFNGNEVECAGSSICNKNYVGTCELCIYYNEDEEKENCMKMYQCDKMHANMVIFNGQPIFCAENSICNTRYTFPCTPCVLTN